MEYANITVQDCLDNYNYRNKTTVIENGQVVDFKDEEKKERIGTGIPFAL